MWINPSLKILIDFLKENISYNSSKSNKPGELAPGPYFETDIISKRYFLRSFSDVIVEECQRLRPGIHCRAGCGDGAGPVGEGVSDAGVDGDLMLDVQIGQGLLESLDLVHRDAHVSVTEDAE